jgi:hypothetical protein
VTNGLSLTYDRDGNHTYPGLDRSRPSHPKLLRRSRLGRVEDQSWQDTQGTPVVKDRFKYAHDANGNRLYRENMVNADFSELNHANNPTAGEEYDGLDRLTRWARGALDAEKDAVPSPSRYQWFGLDQVGNWQTFRDNGTDYVRYFNPDGIGTNEITDLTLWVDPAYDAAGNMKLVPRPGQEFTADQALLCVWDAWNRLTKVYRDNGTGTGNAGVLITDPGWGQTADTLIAEYQYDGRRNRIIKLIPDGAGVGGAAVAGEGPAARTPRG